MHLDSCRSGFQNFKRLLWVSREQSSG
uniref:Uncharacterized protein n=1 Tax=Rhizophora mucronata TaxID=61149 RepID=A0A2P2LT86_RHIMU